MNHHLVLNIALVTLLFSPSSTYNTPRYNYEQEKNNTLTTSDIVDITTSIIAFPIPLATFIHKTAYALTARILTNKPIHIKFGNQTNKKYFAQSKYITLRSLRFLSVNDFDTVHITHIDNKAKKLALLTTGPLCSIASLLILKSLLTHYKFSWIITALYTTFINGALLTEALHGFTPLGGFSQNPSDTNGYQLWDMLNIKQHYLDTLSSIDATQVIVITSALQLWLALKSYPT